MSKITEKDHLPFFLDLETTGLDGPPKDRILEIAIKPTNWDFVPLNEGLSIVIKPEGLLGINVFALEMHRVSGLMEALTEADTYLGQAERQVIQFIEEVEAETGKKAMLAGQGVSRYDSKFIDYWMPSLAECFWYRHLDISSNRSLFIGTGLGHKLPSADKDQVHRAMPDVDAAIREARWMAGFIRGMNFAIS